jgi:predicted membrane-bound mannosyltransferase/DNA-binding beta-propeller fold protein YncE
MSELSTAPDRSERDFLSRPILTTYSLDWEKALYLLFIVFALVTRFYDLGNRVVSHDESLHTQYSFQFYNGDGYQHTPLMHGPVLFHATALAYWLFGDNDYAARVPVALLGVLLVWMPYLLRDWIGRRGALFASFLLLISPYMMYYSRYIRHDIYVITFAFILFIAIQYYLRERKDKYLWWFAVAFGLMFATMETSFIYVAIFGSFLVLALAHHLWQAGWFTDRLSQLRQPIFLILIALLLGGAGFVGQRVVPRLMDDPSGEIAVPQEDLFAADPTATTETGAYETLNRTELVMRWLQIAGIVVLAAALFMAAAEMRPSIDRFGEFDLVVLFTTLTLPAASPILVNIAGWNPMDYSLYRCAEPFFSNVGACTTLFLSSGVVRSGVFLMIALVVSVLVGLWWDARRWLVAAVIYHAIFAIFFTSVFTNPAGWGSGMIGSLGYWLEQHGVQRGNQPYHYYLFVTTLYEFLPILLALLACRLWLAKNRLNKVVGYWLTTFLLALLAFSLARWFFNTQAAFPGAEPDNVPGLIAATIVIALALLFWIFHYQHRLQQEYNLGGSWRHLFDTYALFGLVPYLIWWMFLSWIAYSIAGEKMPWLSTHFMVPMILLSGWYLNQRLAEVETAELLSQRTLTLVGLTGIFLVAAVLALAPILLGQIQLGNQQLDNLLGLGRFLGALLVAALLFYAVWRLGAYLHPATRRLSWLLGFVLVLSLLTIRFAYMASFPNADYVTEFMVYAHGGPATKSQVLPQIEELSLRLHGDMGIRVAYDNDTSWPYTWYLRNFPNRLYYGESPGANIVESPVVLVGGRNWAKVDPILADEFDYQTYTFLWWPMERYRDISWSAIFGDPAVPLEVRRGLGRPAVRQAIWDIFFYRDYTRYGQVFGGDYSIGQWPLRHDLRIYIRKDVTAGFWDQAIGGQTVALPPDPYAENVFEVTADLIIGGEAAAGPAPGQLLMPRNVAIGPDERIYVADSGNHRIQLFDSDGNFLGGWGSFGIEPGQFNEPWGIAVAENFVYVADTWNHRIQKFTLAGEFVALFGHSGLPEVGDAAGLFYGPRDVLVLPDGRLLVTDTGNHRIQVLDSEGNFLDQLGPRGRQLGEMNEPVGLAVGPDGFIYLADTWNARVQRLTPDVRPFDAWDVRAWRGESINNKPYLAADRNGQIYVTDPEAYRVLIFNSRGDFLGRFGRFGQDAGSLGLINGIAVDAAGRVYVADMGNNRIVRYPPLPLPAFRSFPEELPPLPPEELPDEDAGKPVDEPGEESPASSP